MVACDKVNQSQGLIYIHEYNIPDIEEYGNELKKEYNVLDLKKATWIPTKNISSTPFLLTFKEKEPPRFIEILGEQAKTKVFEYFERPRSCKTCLKFEHTAKKCHETIATFAWCSCEGHKKDKCTSNEVKCFHCGEDHQSHCFGAQTASKLTTHQSGPVLSNRTGLTSPHSGEHISPDTHTHSLH